MVCLRFILSALLAVISLRADGVTISGQITDPRGNPVAAATVRVGSAQATSDARGHFSFSLPDPGPWKLSAHAAGFADIARTVTATAGQPLILNLQFDRVAPRTDTINVTARASQPDIGHPDPVQQVLVRDEILDANPGRPGVPVSIPGLPVETASGGIKAPQYFAPGVAGDHGEPIAQFIQVGGFLLPNNLSANAHGNGYADPNILVPAIVESVATDGGAFNVREGNHSVDLAASWSLHPALRPFAALTADYRDADVTAGWNWIAIEASWGNGLLATPEHRQQYKINALKGWNLGAHKLTALFIGYYGKSKVPGLVPIDLSSVDVPSVPGTIDPRQRDQTHTGELAFNDLWRLGASGDLNLSGFFRTYNLSLLSDFGDGLIRQSEFRTVTGGNATYVRRLGPHLSFMTGTDYLRDAPRRDDLDRYDPFRKVTANNITLNFVTPFAAISGDILPWLRYNLGWRRDQIGFDNTDLLTPANSFNKWIAVNSPKATLSLVAPDSVPLPSLSFSFGQAFFTNDPRIGTGTQPGSLVSRAHAWQMVMSRTVLKTDFRVTLRHTTQEASLAKIDPDTGLQFNEGPGVNRLVTVSARRRFGPGLLEASVSKADARDLSDGAPIPQAPRLILDVLGTLDRLPFRVRARAEFEEVGRKPLGDGFVSVPVREFRCALVRDFINNRIEAGVHLQLASGYTGQTTEVLGFEQVVGVNLPSYASASVTYRFGR